MTPTIAIIGALEKEVRQIYTSIEHGTVCEEAGLKIIGGEYHGFNIVSTTAGMGTVNAAAAAQSAGAFTVIAEDGTPDEAIEALIRQRADAKKAKNFAEADRIRDELKARGIEVTDVPNGAKWKHI